MLQINSPVYESSGSVPLPSVCMVWQNVVHMKHF